MIKGKAEIQFGTGDVMTTSLISNNLGVYILENSTGKHNIGDTHPIEGDFTIKDKPVMITFAKAESIDVIIEDLLDIKQMMINGSGKDAKVFDTSPNDFWKGETNNEKNDN